MAPDSIKKFVLRWGPAVVVMGLIFLFSSIHMKPPKFSVEPFKLIKEFVLLKGGHLVGYAMLALAVSRAILRADPASWPASPPTSPEVGSELRGLRLRGWKGLASTMGCALLFALSDELHQSFVPGRSARLIDVGIDLLGAVLGLVIARALGIELNDVITRGKP